MTRNYLPAQILLAFTILTAVGMAGCNQSSDSTTGAANPPTVESSTANPPTVERSTANPPTVESSTVNSPSPEGGAAETPTAQSGSTAGSAPEIALTDAAVSGNVEAVRQHIAAGTDLNERNPVTGSTALIAAATFGQDETALLLIEAGADLEIKNNEGSTALLTAAFLCREPIVKAMLAKGADRNAKNNSGSTALESVAGPFAEVKPIYDLIQAGLGPYGLKLDYEVIQATRPTIAEILRSAP